MLVLANKEVKATEKGSTTKLKDVYLPSIYVVQVRILYYSKSVGAKLVSKLEVLKEYNSSTNNVSKLFIAHMAQHLRL